jgi:hypothetical protein
MITPQAPRALFILKQRQDYSTDLYGFCNYTVATGMYNSANFVAEMLTKAGITAKAVIVADNNSIDREVTAFKPTHVFIEGFWVVPEKFDVLMPLHKHVRWFVRCHSELPFLAQEGIALGWTFQYLQRGIGVAGNSPRIAVELRHLGEWAGVPAAMLDDLTPMLPNYYPIESVPSIDIGEPDDALENFDNNSELFDISCFGAIRPMKNHLMQAVAAVEFAKKHHKGLRFHINTGRVEMYGANTLKNLKALFSGLGPYYELVEHPWTSHEKFLKLVSQMDICMQVSFTETFNIVSADAVNMNVPIVVSEEVAWAYPYFADPNSSDNITKVMTSVWNRKDVLVKHNREALRKFSHDSNEAWVEYFRLHPAKFS